MDNLTHGVDAGFEAAGQASSSLSKEVSGRRPNKNAVETKSISVDKGADSQRCSSASAELNTQISHLDLLLAKEYSRSEENFACRSPTVRSSSSSLGSRDSVHSHISSVLQSQQKTVNSSSYSHITSSNNNSSTSSSSKRQHRESEPMVIRPMLSLIKSSTASSKTKCHSPPRSPARTQIVRRPTSAGRSSSASRAQGRSFQPVNSLPYEREVSVVLKDGVNNITSISNSVNSALHNPQKMIGVVGGAWDTASSIMSASTSDAVSISGDHSSNPSTGSAMQQYMYLRKRNPVSFLRTSWQGQNKYTDGSSEIPVGPWFPVQNLSSRNPLSISPSQRFYSPSRRASSNPQDKSSSVHCEIDSVEGLFDKGQTGLTRPPVKSTSGTLDYNAGDPGSNSSIASNSTIDEAFAQFREIREKARFYKEDSNLSGAAALLRK